MSVATEAQGKPNAARRLLGVSDSNSDGPKFFLPVVIAIFQAVILLFQIAIWSELRDHETRIRFVEDEARAGNRWTLQDHMLYAETHRREIDEKFAGIQADLTDIKIALGIDKNSHKRNK